MKPIVLSSRLTPGRAADPEERWYVLSEDRGTQGRMARTKHEGRRTCGGFRWRPPTHSFSCTLRQGKECAPFHRKRCPKSSKIQPIKTGKRSGTARGNDPKTDQKRSRPAAIGKRKPLAQLWRGPDQTTRLAWPGPGLAGLGWAGLVPALGGGVSLAWPGLAGLTWGGA